LKKIAFIITVYKNDKLEFFKQAVESILKQDYGFENINIYLGIDGGLPDGTVNYIESNKEHFHHIVQNESNKGLAFTLNRLIEILEDEEFVFRMDSDDICKFDRASKQVEVLEADKDLMLVGSELIEIDENGKELRYKKMPVDMTDIIHFSIARNPFNHPTVVMRREFFYIVGVYDESILKSQDYELWGRALIIGIKAINISEPLLYFRVASDYMNKRNSFVNYINEFKISIGLMTHFHKYGQFPKVLAKLLIRIMPSSVGKLVYKKIRG
jgi:hypothetical protein